MSSHVHEIKDEAREDLEQISIRCTWCGKREEVTAWPSRIVTLSKKMSVLTVNTLNYSFLLDLYFSCKALLQSELQKRFRGSISKIKVFWQVVFQQHEQNTNIRFPSATTQRIHAAPSALINLRAGYTFFLFFSSRSRSSRGMISTNYGSPSWCLPSSSNSNDRIVEWR